MAERDFSAFYRAHLPGAVRLAHLLVGQQEVARDVAQDAFVGLHRRWSSVEEPRAYLRRSVVNGAHSWKRREARRRRLPLARPEPAVLGANELDDVLAALPARQRTAVVLAYYEQLSHAEIARVLGCRIGTVGSHLHRALATLRRELA